MTEHRIAARSSLDAWGIDELLTLPEAVELFWPQGPLSVKTLRTAIRDKDLRCIVLARKIYVTRRTIDEMCRGRETRASK